MKKQLGKTFFNRPVLNVASDLLGKFLLRRMPNGEEISAMIIETEAYDGEKDQACHARRGKTHRNTPMFDSAGTIYVYFTYGMHWMLNLVTGPKEYPAAVLIRGVEIGGEKIHGPARLTKRLKIDKKLNHKTLGKGSGLWVEDRGINIKKSDIKRTPRIGVAYAGEWAKKPYRFILK